MKKKQIPHSLVGKASTKQSLNYETKPINHSQKLAPTK